MRSLFIFSAVVLAIVILSIVGYSLYDRYFSSRSPVAAESPAASNSSGTISPSLSFKNLFLKEYLAAYQKVGEKLQSVNSSLSALAGTLNSLNQASQRNDYQAILKLVGDGPKENTDFKQRVMEASSSLSEWRQSNSEVSRADLKTKTEEVINVANDFLQTASGFSEAVYNFLSYKGGGDFLSLSKAVNDLSKKVSEKDQELNQEISDLNKLLSR